MARQPRSFAAETATRTATPLFLGLFGPSSSGKTMSALELATGIQSVVGGDIAMIDTENRRGLHYADDYKFKHIDFQPPFGSLDYLDALHTAEKMGAKTVIIDSMSHEHEGPGGMMETHEAEAVRMATWDGKLDEKKLERVKMLAWNKPKQMRRALLNGMVRTPTNLICCWRAKHTSKPQTVKVEGTNRTKQEVVDMGYTPIGGEEFIFEMTVAALLLPGAKGVPTWFPERPGEKAMVKLTKDHQWLVDRAEKGRPLDAATGAGLARWAQGSTAPKAETRQEPREPVDDREQDTSRVEDREEPRDDTQTAGRSYDGDGYEGV
jgi:hypothetical protein